MNRFTKSAIAGAALVSLLLVGQHGTTPAPALTKEALTYFYEGAKQDSIPNSETGVAASLDVESPSVASGDFHSLGEISAQKDATLNGVVEIGWSVDPGTWGDYRPRLMIYSWVNGAPQGYVKTTALHGFTLNASRLYDPGADLTSFIGTSVSFSITHFSSAWWVLFNGSYIGKFADTVWSGATPAVTFTTMGTFQGFGEVAANSSTPCTDMGTGVLSSTPPNVGAKVGSVTYSVNGSAGVNLTAYTSPNPTKYNTTLVSARTVYWGGPGWC